MRRGGVNMRGLILRILGGDNGKLYRESWVETDLMTPTPGAQIRAVPPPPPYSIWSEPVNVEVYRGSHEPPWARWHLRNKSAAQGMYVAPMRPLRQFRERPSGWRRPIPGTPGAEAFGGLGDAALPPTPVLVETYDGGTDNYGILAGE